MRIRKIYENIIKLEEIYGEDFSDLGGLKVFNHISNLEALKYLKKTRPFIYRHICDAYMDLKGEDINILVKKADPGLEKISADAIFDFDYEIEDEEIFDEILDELSDIFDDEFDEDELYKIVIAILGNHFKEVEDCLMDIFEEIDD